jgi:hypothetical protein
VRTSEEFIEVLRDMRTNPNSSVNQVQLLGKVIYNLSPIMLEYQAEPPAERYLRWPNIVCLNSAATIVIKILTSSAVSPSVPLTLIPMLADNQTATMNNVIITASSTDSTAAPAVTIGTNATLDLGITQAMYDIQRVRGNMSVSFVQSFTGTPNVIFTAEECDLLSLNIVRTLASNVRNTKIGCVNLNLEGNPGSNLQISWNFDNCVFTGYESNPAVITQLDNVSQAAINFKTCRFIGTQNVEAIRLVSTGFGGINFQSCVFDWENTVLVDFANTALGLVAALFASCFDQNPNDQPKFTESNGGVVGSGCVIGVTNFVPANFSAIAVTTLGTTLVG